MSAVDIVVGLSVFLLAGTVKGLVGLGLKTSKRGGYAPPLVKRYEGIFAAAAPQG